MLLFCSCYKKDRSIFVIEIESNVHLHYIPCILLLIFESNQLFFDTLLKLHVLDHHEINIFQTVAQDRHHFVLVHSLHVDATRQLVDQCIAHQWDFDTIKEKHRKTETFCQKCIR